METNNNTTKSVHLQGIGRVNAKPAAELRAGDVTIWNYGYTETVLDVAQISPMFVRVALKSERDPFRVFYRRLKIDRLVAVQAVKS